ncbi:sensor histidine kinase [Flavobacterium caeni]|uniref:Histidine kinase n=1 Tax=Flavobacterium caeni TaxID=490189 RepID=A0A1G5G8H2_9FLAO|nr:sensor histidine kinase [Flavobacterium caeni]SCY47803.1 Histidine kinase [Flavobacterium caeni]
MSNFLRNYTLHILWVLVFLSIPIVTSPDLGDDMLAVGGFKRNFLSYVLLVVFFYLNYYVFIPRYYFAKRYFLFGAIVFFSYAMIVAIPEFVFEMKFNAPPIGSPNGPPPGFEGKFRMGPRPNGMFFILYGGSVFQFLLVLILSIMLRTRHQLRLLSSEKLKAEVSYLKAQINPHFLFNTLNSLYALTIAKSDDAPDAVIKLSNMMRYVVTESSNDLVPLEKEINYIKDYIDLQKLRIADASNLEFTIIGNTQGKRIAPLVVIPFIENAFKYGVNAEEDWHISIAIEITENDFILGVSNNKVNVQFSDDEASEQGIDNTKKRLEIIYPGKHELVIKDEPHHFNVHLKINWS